MSALTAEERGLWISGLTAGDVVEAQWPDGEGWLAARVERVNGDGSFVVSYTDAKRVCPDVQRSAMRQVNPGLAPEPEPEGGQFLGDARTLSRLMPNVARHHPRILHAADQHSCARSACYCCKWRA